MLKHLLLIGLLFSGTCAAKDITYSTYENGAAEYSVAIPDGILYGQGESGNHMGQVFKSEDMDAVLFTYGEGNIDDKGIDALFLMPYTRTIRQSGYLSIRRKVTAGLWSRVFINRRCFIKKPWSKRIAY